MKKLNKDIIDRAKAYVVKLLNTTLPDEYLFHSVDHTLEVYKFSQIIGKEIGLSSDDLIVLGISAIFHDAGYVVKYDGHEKESVKIAKQFLESENLSEDIIDQVERAIMATKVPQKPVDIISRALCDADLMNLTRDNYFENVRLMRKEWKLSGRADLSVEEFHKSSIEFMENHNYHTTYGREILAPLKKKTIKLIKEKISD